jgi:lipopolysaccharide biosynthesis glycosyltransferase
MKSQAEKGHRESMNVIWNKLKEINPKYWIHMEDDWLYFKQENYVTKSMEALEKYESEGIHQIVFNREYGLMMNDIDRVNVESIGNKNEGLVIHLRGEGFQGPNCAYWPHYSLQPSMCRASKIIELGDYSSQNTFFERDFADKYNAAGYKTIFYDFIYSLHIGKQHWEKEGQNAYALNQVSQLSGTQETNIETTVEITMKERNEPLEGSMRNHLELILKKIKSNTPFGLIRPSDGEYKILNNESLTNLDNWTFEQGGKLREQLFEAISTVNPNLYIGIPCDTCNKPWNCTSQIYNTFIETFKVPLGQRTYANLVGNSNWKPFTEFLKSYTPRFYLITSGTSPSELPIKERFLISDKLVNTWNVDGESETQRLLRFIKGKGQLFLFSAGPLSKIWIPMCLNYNPENMYMDVGASLDIFTKGETNRLYTSPEHPFSRESCCFKDSLALTVDQQIPSILPHSREQSRFLVYLGIFYNKDYLELLKELIISVKLFSFLYQIDFLILTTEDFTPEINQLSMLTGIPLKTFIIDPSNLAGAAFARLNIFEFPEISNYEKVLYLDTDIIIQGDLQKVFELDIEDKLYAMSEGTIEHEIHGGQWFDFEKIDKHTIGLNSGILLFKPTDTMRRIFSEINDHISEMKSSGKPMPQCEDQAFINYHFIKENKYDNKLIERYSLIYCIDPPPPPSKPTDIVICHFVWPIGNAKHKMGRMKPHLTHILKNYRDIYETSLNEPIYNTLGSTYSWGDCGWIRFNGNGFLETMWIPGTYEWLDSHSAYANWAGFVHFLRFNTNYTNYISIRLDDIEIGRGLKQLS